MTDSEAGSGDPDEATGPDSPDVAGESPAGPELPTGSRRTDDSAPSSERTVVPSDAFGALGNEIRMTVLRELAAAERDDDGTRSFSDLFEATSADTTAGFAYHLRQLDDRYVTETEEGYRLTYAGRKIARAIAAGTYTDSVDRSPVAVDDPCPFCAADSLSLLSADNYTSVACETCERVLLTLPFPPGGHRGHDETDLPRAFDRYNRHRIALLSDGICPECGGAVERSVERPPEDLREQLPDESGDRVRLAASCPDCGYRLRCPVTLSVLSHPAVVSFYREHDEDVDERPLWNVGAEWRESLVSEDPWCVLVSTRLADEVLDLYLDATGEVVATRRSDAD